MLSTTACSEPLIPRLPAPPLLPADLAIPRAPAARTFPKACACGVVHLASSWSTLDYCGVMKGIAGEAEFPDLELRNCACGSTLAVELEP